MSGFVIQYHRPSRRWKVTEFPGREGVSNAVRFRIALEDARDDRDWEIASLNSDSLDTIKRTHSRYFEGAELAS
jgi:hypothetical protein